VELRDPRDDRQAEAGAPRFRRVEREKDLLALRRGDALPPVAHREEDLAVAPGPLDPDCARLAAPLLRRGFDAVAQQVDERAADEDLRARNGGERAPPVDGHSRKGGLGLGRRRFGDGSEVDRLRHEPLGPREEQEVARHAAHLLGLAADRHQVLGGFRRRPQREVREAVDRGGRVAELVRRPGGDLAQIGQVARERDAGLELPHLGQIREKGEDPEEAPVRALRRSHRHPERAGLLSRDPADFAASDRPAIPEDVADQGAEVRDRRESLAIGLPVLLPRQPENLPTRLVQLDDPLVRPDRENAGGQVSREETRGGLEVVGARLELPLLLAERRNRRLEPADQELPLVTRLPGARGKLGRRTGRAPRSREQPVVGREKGAQVEAGEDDEGRARERNHQRERPGERPEGRARARVDGDRDESDRGGSRSNEEGRIPPPGELDLPRPRPGGRQCVRSVELRSERLGAAALAVVSGDVDHVRLQGRPPEGGARRVLGPSGRCVQPAQDLGRAPFDGLAPPVDRAPEEKERDEVQEQNEEKRDPEKHPGLAAERPGNRVHEVSAGAGRRDGSASRTSQKTNDSQTACPIHRPLPGIP